MDMEVNPKEMYLKVELCRAGEIGGEGLVYYFEANADVRMIQESGLFMVRSTGMDQPIGLVCSLSEFPLIFQYLVKREDVDGLSE